MLFFFLSPSFGYLNQLKEEFLKLLDEERDIQRHLEADYEKLMKSDLGFETLEQISQTHQKNLLTKMVAIDRRLREIVLIAFNSKVSALSSFCSYIYNSLLVLCFVCLNNT